MNEKEKYSKNNLDQDLIFNMKCGSSWPICHQKL